MDEEYYILVSLRKMYPVITNGVRNSRQERGALSFSLEPVGFLQVGQADPVFSRSGTEPDLDLLCHHLPLKPTVLRPLLSAARGSVECRFRR